MMRRTISSVAILALSCAVVYAQSEKLSGTPIGTQQCVDYTNTSAPTTTVNTVADAFDGNFDTCFASWERSYTWCGLDLGTPQHFNDYIDNLSQEVARSAALNFMRWPILNQKVHMNPKTYLSYDYAVKDLRSFCTSRIYWLDNKIGYDKDIIDNNAGIFTVSDEALTTYMIGNQLFCNTKCNVYDVTGLLIGKVETDSPLTLPARSLYILSKPGKSVKVLY